MVKLHSNHLTMKGSGPNRLITETITVDAEKISIVEVPSETYKLIYHNILQRFLRIVESNGIITLDVSELSNTTIDPNWEWERFLVTDNSDATVHIQNQTNSKYLTMSTSGVLGLADTVTNDCKFKINSTGGLFSSTHGRYVMMDINNSIAHGLNTTFRTANTPIIASHTASLTSHALEFVNNSIARGLNTTFRTDNTLAVDHTAGQSIKLNATAIANLQAEHSYTLTAVAFTAHTVGVSAADNQYNSLTGGLNATANQGGVFTAGGYVKELHFPNNRVRVSLRGMISKFAIANGVVTSTGVDFSINASSYDTILTLPADVRPTNYLTFACPAQGYNLFTTVRIDISSSGVVSVITGGQLIGSVFLNNIHYWKDI